MERKEINELVKLYFVYNPKMDKGISFRIKANDIITKYANEHNMPFDDIKHCIESNPMCKEAIWNQFYNYWFKKDLDDNKKKVEKSHYKNSISDSTNPDDWL